MPGVTGFSSPPVATLLKLILLLFGLIPERLCILLIIAPQHKKDIEDLGRVHNKAVRDLGPKSYTEWLRELGLFGLGKGRLRGDLTAFHNSLRRGCGEVHSSSVQLVIGREGMASSCAR